MKSNYRIIRKIYQGNQGPVLHIKDKSGKDLILKRYTNKNTSKGVDPSILMEGIILNLVKGQDNLIQYNRIERTDDDIDFFIEKLDGEITELILSKLSLGKIKDYMKQILNGLLNLHSHGIIHNDIKPRNILFKKSKSTKVDIKIIDFGLVFLVNYPYYRAGEIQTTHHYTPPEYNDHREIGRISVNSDIYSLGIIFYYMINPEAFRQLDYETTDDYIFDPNQVDRDIVKDVVGKHGLDLLDKMLDLHPESRISSIRALKHPFFKNSKQSGGGDRRWELPNLMSRNEYRNRRNQEEFLDLIVEKSIGTKVIVAAQQQIPIQIWNVMYDLLEDNNFKFITLNYAIYLMLYYLTYQRIRPDRWENLATACLFLSSKINEFDNIIKINSYTDKVKKTILNYETELIELFDFKLPLPILITKEIILYDTFTQIIYDHKYIKKPISGHIYNLYYMMELLSSVAYFDPSLLDIKKENLVMAILAFQFNSIPHSPSIKQKLIDLLKSKRNLFWIERDLLKFWNID